MVLLVSEGLEHLVREVLNAEGLQRIDVISFPVSLARSGPASLCSLLKERQVNVCGLITELDIGPEEVRTDKRPCHRLLMDAPSSVGADGRYRTEVTCTIAAFIWKAVSEAEREEALKGRQDLERAMSEHAAFLDIMKLVATVRDEDKVVSTILDLFVVLFSPRSIQYAYIDGPKVLRRQSKGDSSDEGWSPRQVSQGERPPVCALTDDGFSVRIEHMGTLVGWMEVQRLSYPIHRARYLDLARGIAPIFGLAISNARYFQDLTRMSKEVLMLNESLKITNKITRHDIRNELVVAHGSIQLFQLKKDPAKLEQALRSLERIDRQLAQLKELDGMLAQGEPLRKMELHEVVEEIAKHYPMRTTVAGRLSAAADQALFSVIDNLFRNAMVHGRAENVSVDIRESGGSAEIRVADDGMGIDPSVMDRIFEEGFSHGETKGTGLGLFIASRTMARYGGAIAVCANRPRGTVFTLRLPLPKQE